MNFINYDCYRQLMKALVEARIVSHTFENNQSRPFKIMAKYLPSSCNPERIKRFYWTWVLKLCQSIMICNGKKKYHWINFWKKYKTNEILESRVEIVTLKRTESIPQLSNFWTHNNSMQTNQDVSTVPTNIWIIIAKNLKIESRNV